MMQTRVDTGVDPARGLLAAIVVHIVAYYAMASVDPPAAKLDIVEFDVAELPPPEPRPEPEAPEPEPEPKPPEPTPEPEPEPPKPKIKPKAPPPRPTPSPAPPNPHPNPHPAAPAEPIDLPESRTIGPVTVAPGEKGGKPGGTPGGAPGGGGAGKPTGGAGQGKPGPAWQPKSDLYIAKSPRVLDVPEKECPAVQDLRISGTVVLLVQVRRDGSVKQARVTKGIGHGCDEIASKALRSGKFAPAIGTDGKPADYELRYEYVFELEG